MEQARTDTVEQLQARMAGLFGDLLGIHLLEARPDYVKGELFVRDDLCTLPGRMHGGAMMAFADQLGAFATVLNLPPGCGTTTIESKTNFVAGVPSGVKVIGETTPLHRGKQTHVWQTRLALEDGKLVALVTQTQMVLQPKS